MIPGSGRSPGEGNSYLLQYSGLENPMDGGAGRPIVHGVAKSWIQLSARTHTHTHNGLMGEGCQNSEFYPTGVEAVSFSPSISPDPKEARNPEVHKDEHRSSSQRTLLFLVCGKENGKGHDLGSERVPCFCWGFFLFFLLFSLQSPGSTEVEA